MAWPDFLPFVLALALGLLVGLERERTGHHLAGIRTFPLITLLGALCGRLAGAAGEWLLAAGLLALAALFWIGNRVRLERDAERDPGLTTEVAALVMFAVGAALARDLAPLAVFLGGATALLLHWKRPLHGFVERIGEDEFRAIARLVLIGMVILPVLPDRAYGPYQVLNPYEIWRLVVLIVGISLLAYLARRLLGARVGTLLAGVLGGLVSSTATTVSYARRSREAPDDATASAVVVMIASATVFLRVLLEVALVAPTVLPAVAAPLAVFMLLMIGLAGLLYWRARRELAASRDDDRPPRDLTAAVAFGLLYAVVLFAVAAAREHLGDAALYGVAALSGLTDLDAITLSTAQLLRVGDLPLATGWRLIVVGVLANLAFKAGVVALLGHRRLRRRVVPLLLVALAAGGAILLLWPA